MESLGAYEQELYRHIDEKHPEVWTTIREKKAITDDFRLKFEEIIQEFHAGRFVASKG